MWYTRYWSPPTHSIPIPYREEYRYFGFPHRTDGIDFALHLQSRSASFAAAFHRLRPNSFLWPSNVRLAMYRTFVAPIIEYGSIVWDRHRLSYYGNKPATLGTQLDS